MQQAVIITCPLPAQPVQLTTKITRKQSLKLSGQVLAASGIILEVKKELLSSYHGNHKSLASAIGKSMKVSEAINVLLRAIGYIDTDELDSGQEGISTNE
ncbi:hypothetical protein KAR91_08000 [Candidatus Pacearchaeota archaeon]|nr:hypothetical protein [Candidatus Pacearchaeota archaeon]